MSHETFDTPNLFHKINIRCLFIFGLPTSRMFHLSPLFSLKNISNKIYYISKNNND